jgi:DNA-binding XRE family transcriptional regulator
MVRQSSKAKAAGKKKASKPAPEKSNPVPRNIPISLVTIAPSITEHKFEVPAKVLKEVLPLLEKYRVPPQEQLTKLVKNPSPRVKGRPEEAIRFSLLRLEHRLTQSQMAHRIGTDQSQVSLIELGKKGISRAVATKLEQEFGVKAEDYWWRR